MKPNQALLEHSFWEATNPSLRRLVRVSRPFPPELNPFIDQGVVIRAAGVPGEVQHSKWIVAREGIWHGIKNALIDQDTTVIEATSGNTGQGIAEVCTALGIRFIAVVSGDVPQDKVNAIRAMGRDTSISQPPNPKEESTVEHARRRGKEHGYYNPDQYAGEWNWQAHRNYLAPQLWKQAGEISILTVPAGTMGTSIGLTLFARENNKGTTVIPVVCADDEEIPGARTLKRIRRDIRLPWEDFFSQDKLESGKRHASFYLSFLSWPYVMPHLGPSFGLGFSGALNFLRKNQEAGTLDKFRRSEGKIQVVVFGPDDSRPYFPLYLGELKEWELSSKMPPENLLAVLDQ